MKVCIVGASGKLGQYMVQHALDRGYEVVGVCRVKSVEKLDAFKGRISVVPGATNDRGVIKEAVAGCDGVLTVLVPWGVDGYSTDTAQAVLDHAPAGARLVFSCGWHITRDGQDVYSRWFKLTAAAFARFGRFIRMADLDDQVEACRRVFASDTRWTVVRGSDLEEGESQGLPVWSRHVGDPILRSNITRRVDFALFMVEALGNDELIHEAPAIVGRLTPSALAHAAPVGPSTDRCRASEAQQPPHMPSTPRLDRTNLRHEAILHPRTLAGTTCGLRAGGGRRSDCCSAGHEGKTLHRGRGDHRVRHRRWFDHSSLHLLRNRRGRRLCVHRLVRVEVAQP